ncbi:MAG TPA: DUF389 domain-containing protein [Euzebyales bacterium]
MRPDAADRGDRWDLRRARDGVGRALAASPVVWRGAIAAVGIVVLVAARSGVTELFDEIVGVTLIAIAVLEHAPRLVGGHRAPWWRSGLTAAAGVAMVAWPSETSQSVGLVAAALIATYGAVKSVQAFGSAARERRYDRLARGVLTVALAIVVALFPEATVRVVVVGTGLLWIFRASLVAAAIGRADTMTAAASRADAPPRGRLPGHLTARQMGQVDRDRIDATLFFDGDDGRRRLFRFAILMALSTALATFGVAADSTAVVIGAMLIAPLMTPILATASAVLRGWTAGALRSGGIVLVATVAAVALAYVLTGFVPDLPTVVANDEVTSRTAPNLLDLAIAVAAGAAGAFAVSRSDVSEALPGVAVAIALVPPLAVTGVTLYAGSYEQAAGAMLLFVTNLTAIVAMASAVFLLTGYVDWSRLLRERRRVRTSYATVATGVVLLLIPLGLTTKGLIDDAAALRASQRAASAWLDGTDGISVAALEVEGDRVSITVHGAGTPPAPEVLHARLVEELDREVVVEMRFVPEVVHVIGGDRP